jgi:hypothetical protein
MVTEGNKLQLYIRAIGQSGEAHPSGEPRIGEGLAVLKQFPQLPLKKIHFITSFLYLCSVDLPAEKQNRLET